MFYSQVILAKKGPLAKVWLAAHWGDKKLGRPQIFATDISQSVESIVNPSVPLALRVSGHLLLGVVRIYSRKVKYVLNDCTEAMLKLQMAFLPRKDLLEQTDGKENKAATTVANFGEYDQVHVVEGFALPLPDQNEWILAEDDEEDGEIMTQLANTQQQQQQQQQHSSSPQGNYQPPQEETWVPFDPENEDEDIQTDPLNQSLVSEVELVRAADESFLSGDQVSSSIRLLELALVLALYRYDSHHEAILT
jgi:cohesin complex subunit SCC1